MKKMLVLGLIGFGAWNWYSGRRQFAQIRPDGSIVLFDSVDRVEFGRLMFDGKPIILEGGKIVHEYAKTSFMGGWLYDGCPENVVLGHGWLAGQTDLLSDAGITPYCKVV
jgi:hypothetical protein